MCIDEHVELVEIALQIAGYQDMQAIIRHNGKHLIDLRTG